MNRQLIKASLLAIGAGVAAWAMPTTAQTADAEEPFVTAIVDTADGQVQGLRDGSIDAFLGLRYAAPPLGSLRFMPPAPLAPWDGIYDATAVGAPCMQMYAPSGGKVTDFTRRMQAIFPTSAEAKIENEDCLFLNVWTPRADAKARPVMVWFHGGGYAYGSGAWPVYDGRNLAAKGDVVVVTVNHRLNAFGYSFLGDVDARFAHSGNAGNLDLVAALEWVRANIAAFGGDPANVTIMGESGGGSKVSHLMAMPSAAGLFAKAIVQSGPGVTGIARKDGDALARALMARLQVNDAQQLQAVPADKLLAAARMTLAEQGASGGTLDGIDFRPVVDGDALPRDPFSPAAPEQVQHVPLMIGWNKDEMTIFTASQDWYGKIDDAALDAMAPRLDEKGSELVAHYRRSMAGADPSLIASRVLSARFFYGSYLMADRKSVQGAPVYAYRLAWETPVNGGIFASPHTLDLPFMFDNVDKARVLTGPGKAPETLAAMMSDAWISFAHNGRPSSDLLPEWPEYDPVTRQFMQFDLTPEVVADPEGAMRRIKAGTD